MGGGSLAAAMLDGDLALARSLAGGDKWLPNSYKLGFVVRISRDSLEERDRWARRWLLARVGDYQRPPRLHEIAAAAGFLSGLPNETVAREFATWCGQHKLGFAGDVTRVVLLGESPVHYYPDWPRRDRKACSPTTAGAPSD